MRADYFMKMANNCAIIAHTSSESSEKGVFFMKKLVGITGLILIACVCIGTAAAPSPAQEGTAPTAAVTEAAQGYVIGDSDGNIAVFVPGEAAPVMVTQTRTDALPRPDSRRVREGIAVADSSELRRLLEDFCS